MNYELLQTALYPHPLVVVNGKLFLLSSIERIIPTNTGVMIHFLSGGSLPLDNYEVKEFEEVLKTGMALAAERNARANSQIVVPTITTLKGN